MKYLRKARLTIIGPVVLWLLAVAVGLSIVFDYEGSPGAAATAPPRWPTDSRIYRAPERATLVMLAHPHCPCTRASIRELDLLKARADGRVMTYVLFLKPPGFPDAWEETDLWRSAAAIPGVTALSDEAGDEARRFGAATSGQAILDDTDGHLLFSGGITASRGHSGDNAGRSAIMTLLGEGQAAQAETLVFGCPLFNKGSECLTGEPNHAVHEH